MSVKFGRTYSLTIEGLSGEVHTFEYPLTLTFSVERSQWASANSGKFSIYGLGAQSRKDISFDLQNVGSKNPKTGLPFFTIRLRAGYLSQGPLTEVFAGNINLAYTTRQHSDLITNIEAFDGGYGLRNAVYTASLKEGWHYKTEAEKAIQAGGKFGLAPGKVIVSNPPQTPLLAVSGPLLTSLKTHFMPDNGSVFVDQGKLNILGFKDVLPGATSPTIGPQTGLLDVPIVKGNTITCSCIFEPSYYVGQQVTVKSTLNPNANADCKIMTVGHDGTISGVESGSAITRLSLLLLKARPPQVVF